MKSQRTVSLTIVKILNWDRPKLQGTFVFQFVSLSTAVIILTKQIAGAVQGSQVHFNCCLRISYIAAENQMLIRLRQTHSQDQDGELIAEFTINLDFLSKKRVQLLPFGSGHKALKLTIGEDGFLSKKEKLQRESRLNEEFIREKEDYLRRASNSLLRRQLSSKRTCSQKAIGLLHQLNCIKQGYHENVKPKFSDYGTAVKDYGAPTSRISRNDQLGRLPKDRNVKKRGELQSSRQSSRSQKHQLQINNLQMVPCQSQYYQISPVLRTRERNQQPITRRSKHTQHRPQYY